MFSTSVVVVNLLRANLHEKGTAVQISHAILSISLSLTHTYRFYFLTNINVPKKRFWQV